MIGERVFYFHQGKSQESAWRAKVTKPPIKNVCSSGCSSA